MLLILSLLVRISAALAIGLRPDPSFLDMDERQYYEQATAILHGSYTPDLRRPIGYVSVLALLKFLTAGNFAALQIANAAVSGLAGPLMYLLVRRVTPDRVAAVVASCLVILWPPFLYYGRTLYSETATLPLFMVCLIVLPLVRMLDGRAAKRRPSWFCSGILLGACVLFRPMYLLFYPFLVLLVLLDDPRWKLVFGRAFRIAGGMLLIILPWSLCLTAKAGTFVLVSTTGGETLATGLNPVLIARGYQRFQTPDGRQSWTGPGKFLSNVRDTGYLTEEELQLPLPEVDNLLRRRVVAWVVRNPGPAAYLERAKLLYMWGFYPIWGKEWPLNVLAIAALLMGVLSLIRFHNCFRQLAVFWVLPVYVSSVTLIGFGSWRYRQPGDVGLLALSALLLCSLRER